MDCQMEKTVFNHRWWRRWLSSSFSASSYFPLFICFSIAFHYCLNVSYDLWCRIYRLLKYQSRCDKNKGFFGNRKWTKGFHGSEELFSSNILHSAFRPFNCEGEVSSFSYEESTNIEKRERKNTVENDIIEVVKKISHKF